MGSYRDGGLGQEWEEKADDPRAIPTDNMTTSRSSADNFRNLVSASERSHGQGFGHEEFVGSKSSRTRPASNVDLPVF